MNIVIELETDKGILVVTHIFDKEALDFETGELLVQDNLDKEHFNGVLAMIMARDLLPVLKGVLDTYDKGPPKESLIVPIGNKNPGKILDMNGKVMERKPDTE